MALEEEVQLSETSATPNKSNRPRGGDNALAGLLLAAVVGGILPAAAELLALPAIPPGGEWTLVGGALLTLACGPVCGLAPAVIIGLMLRFLFPGGLSGFRDWLWHSVRQCLAEKLTPERGRLLLAGQAGLFVGAAGWFVLYFAIAVWAIRGFNKATLIALLLTAAAPATMAVAGVMGIAVKKITLWLLPSPKPGRKVSPLWIVLLPSSVVLALLLCIAPAAAFHRGYLTEAYWVAQVSATLFLTIAILLLLGLTRARVDWRKPAAGLAVSALLFGVLGSNARVRLAGERSAMLSGFALHVVRTASDLDRDGFGFLFGGPDCAPFDPNVNPAAKDTPGNGEDEDCNGYDAAVTEPRPPAPRLVAPAPGKPRDIVLITMDAVRADHVSAYGYHLPTTPNFDALAARSARFLRAYSPGPSTTASVPALVTGRNLHNVALNSGEGVRGLRVMRDEAYTLAEYLVEQGFRTEAVLSHRFFAPKNNWGQGFDGWHIPIQAKGPVVSSPQVLEKSLEVLSSHRSTSSKPLFLWAHFYDAHADYVPHTEAPFPVNDAASAYDSEIWYTDRHAGRLIDAALSGPRGDRTIVIVTSDHGEGLGEHDNFGKHRTLNHECLHVPLLIYVPGLPAVEIAEPVSLIDLFPTIADLIGGPRPDSVLGYSLAPGVAGGSLSHRGPVFAEVSWRGKIPRTGYVSAISSDKHLIKEVYSGRLELYDLAADPDEQCNLLLAGPEAAAGLLPALDRFLESTVIVTPGKRRIP